MGTQREPPEPPADDQFTRIALDRHGARYTQRLLLNTISALVALVVILATLPVTLPLGRRVLTQLFPPPPYRGTYAYVSTQIGFVLALRSNDGTVHCRVTSSHYDGEVEVADGSVITVQPEINNQQPAERIVALSASDGQVRWSAPPTQHTLQLLGTEGGAVYAVETPSLETATPSPTTLLAYDAATGKLRWQYMTPNSTSVGLAPTFNGLTPSLRAGTLYFSGPGGGPEPSDMLTALDLATGKPRWQSPVSLSGRVVAGDASLVYVLSSSAFEAVSATTGVLRWQRGDVVSIWNSSLGPTAVPTGVPLLLSTYTGYAGLDSATGAVRWQGTWPYDDYVSPGGAYNPLPEDPALGDGRYYWFDGATAFAMSSATGKILWQTSVPYSLVTPGASGSSEYYIGGTLYCIADNQIVALDGATGSLRWSQVTAAGAVDGLQVAP